MGIFLGIVAGLAVLFLLWLAAGFGPGRALGAALAVLAVGSPTALLPGVTAALCGAAGSAAVRGVYFRNFVGTLLRPEKFSEVAKGIRMHQIRKGFSGGGRMEKDMLAFVQVSCNRRKFINKVGRCRMCYSHHMELVAILQNAEIVDGPAFI